MYRKMKKEIIFDMTIPNYPNILWLSIPDFEIGIWRKKADTIECIEKKISKETGIEDFIKEYVLSGEYPEIILDVSKCTCSVNTYLVSFLSCNTQKFNLSLVCSAQHFQEILTEIKLCKMATSEQLSALVHIETPKYDCLYSTFRSYLWEKDQPYPQGYLMLSDILNDEGKKGMQDRQIGLIYEPTYVEHRGNIKNIFCCEDRIGYCSA